MSDDGTTDSAPAGTRWWLIALILALVGSAVLLAFLLFSNDDGSDSSDTTLASTTIESTTTTIESTTTTPETTTTTPETTTTTPGTTTTSTSTTTSTTTTSTTQPPQTELEFGLRDIADGGTVPVEFTCDGNDTPPIVNLETVPDGTRQFAMIVDDPDAPTPDPFVHWVVYAIPEGTAQFTDASPDLTYGTNDFGETNWLGPCPPPGDGPHQYVFTLYALDEALDLAPDLDGRALFTAIEESIITDATITATYERAPA
jgi:Raf kinase inhibitor-like YbhB/YbcL family protein